MENAPTPESDFFEVLGRIEPIMETFSKGQKTHQQEIYTIVHDKKSQKRGLYYSRNLTENLKNFTPRKSNF